MSPKPTGGSERSLRKPNWAARTSTICSQRMEIRGFRALPRCSMSWESSSSVQWSGRRGENGGSDRGERL